METPKLIILLLSICCTYHVLASDHSHIIPVEEYETELQNLGQSVELHETPVKVIKIIKTIAVKVPVPYPVKVIEKVPYPVHVSKPYPVPVPQIIHVPHTKPHHEHEGGSHDSQESYKVQESPYDLPTDGHSDQKQHFGAFDDDSSSQGGSSYDGPNSYHGYSGDSEGNGSFETKSYDQAVKNYLQKHHLNGNTNSFSYH